ncbi:hypothetical protein JG688_00007091 [Phytophthora aleatoria]|uniref:Core-binding (CB) domain-containing protein n=1 Tax=Phytophthora aleatoria TaxID=2496075 RepID=A0A8J5MGK3_9STRA|nr:hypothetical protein JG688_00007091 [Phytophthora aleatoria]
MKLRPQGRPRTTRQLTQKLSATRAYHQTRKKYASNLNVIKEWIHDHLSKEESNTNRVFDGSGDINLVEFTPGYIEKFLVYKRRGARTATLGGYRSAIKDLYRLKRIALPVEYGDDMKQLFSGMKRLEAELNQSSTPKTSGKQPRTDSLYNELCESTLMLCDSDFSVEFDVQIHFCPNPSNPACIRKI